MERQTVTQRMQQTMEGSMYRLIDGVMTEIVKHGEELLPVTDPRVREYVGQMALFDLVETEDFGWCDQGTYMERE